MTEGGCCEMKVDMEKVQLARAANHVGRVIGENLSVEVKTWLNRLSAEDLTSLAYKTVDVVNAMFLACINSSIDIADISESIDDLWS